ncbi:MAG: hypothetical protein IKD18_01640, partial [Clostridia bacterium]|nr:hypothetical protein [Clostridia bacterium]
EKKEAPKAPKEKKGGKKLPIIIAAIVAVVIIAFVVVAFVMGSSAINAYGAKDYAAAYNNSKLALFMSADDKNVIKEAYVKEVLCKEEKYFTAAEILEKSSMTEEKKNEIYASNPALALCKEGQIVKFGKYESDNNAANGPEDVEWIVLEVTKENGKARALLLSKDIIGAPGGWNKTDGNTFYSASNLHDWCESDFYLTFTMYDASLKDKILKMKVATADSSTGVDSGEDVAAHAYAPAKEDLDKYLTGDLAKYIIASPTASAKAAGVTAYGKEQAAQYYLRNVGNVENNAQWAAGIDKKGAFNEGLAMSGNATGARVCINVDLGELK